MSRPVIMKEINAVTGDKFNDIRLRCVTVDKHNKAINIEFVYKDKLNDSDKQQLNNHFVSMLPKSFALSFTYIKSHFDQKTLQNTILQFLKEKHSFAFNGLTKEQVNMQMSPNGANIELRLEQGIKGYINNNRVLSKLLSCVNSRFVGVFNIDFVYYDDKSVFDKQKYLDEKQKEAEAEQATMPIIEVTEQTKYQGRIIDQTPYFINVADAGIAKTTMCGTASNFRMLKSAKNKDFAKFDLQDSTGKITVIMFFKNTNLEKFQPLEDGQEVIVSGKLEFSTYTNDYTMIASAVNKCVIPKQQQQTGGYAKQLPAKYKCVEPQPVVNIKQQSLFESDTQEHIIEGTVVVIDLETTGLDSNADKIIEIGAVKIVDGTIVEQFGTLINPERPIEKRIADITRLTDNDVKNAPTIDKVITDLLKFVDNHSIAAYNAKFDHAFIKYNAEKYKYSVNNRIIDVMDLVRENVSDISNLSLGKALEYFNLKNEDKHRALSDAMATAELLIELCKKYSLKL